MIADMVSHKNLNTIVTMFYIRGRKLNIYLVFIPQHYFAAKKNMRLNSKDYFLAIIPNKQSHLIIHQILTLKTMRC